MTLQLLHSEFPYIWGKLDFLFYQCILTLYGIAELTYGSLLVIRILWYNSCKKCLAVKAYASWTNVNFTQKINDSCWMKNVQIMLYQDQSSGPALVSMRIWIQVLMTKNCKILQLTISYLLNKKLQSFPWASMKDVQATRKAFSHQERTSSTSKHDISSLFSIFVGNFDVLYPADQNQCGPMQIRIHITDQWREF